jgi:CCR4-NOT complex subunit CAF16
MTGIALEADPGDRRPPAVVVRGLDFRYHGAQRLALARIELTLAPGCRCLLIGRNGAGKTTLLRVLAGKHLIPADQVRILGRPAFHDTSLPDRVMFLGGRFPFRMDVTVRERLVAMLDIDPDWHMDRVSDGQRRRVQLLLGLLAPAEVLLLDEVTSDLDLVARADLLDFLRDESRRGATILYATHVLDELEEWATHLALMEGGRMLRLEALGKVPELAALRAAGVPSPLTRLVLGWLRRGPAPVAEAP